jgi:hypothetical protein
MEGIIAEGAEMIDEEPDPGGQGRGVDLSGTARRAL